MFDFEPLLPASLTARREAIRDMEVLFGALGLCEPFLAPLVGSLALYRIDDPREVAEFCAQAGHETAGLVFAQEIWGPTEAQRGYEGRADLGNKFQGDGFNYRGRGLFQYTGRYNYRALTGRLRARFGVDAIPDFEARPDLLTKPVWACMSAADYWAMRGLGQLVKKGATDLVTLRINGGYNGKADRDARRRVNLKHLGVL